MDAVVLLDSGVLGLVTSPSKKNLQVAECKQWLDKLLRSRVVVILPEIIYYETRRKYIHNRSPESCQRLEEFINSPRIGYASITKEIIVKATELWGWARLTNQGTAHNESIDIDVILAATAIEIATQESIHTVIATTNVVDLERYTSAKEWKDINKQYFKTVFTKS